MNKSYLIYTSLYLVSGGIIASVFLWTPHVQNDYPFLRIVIITFATVLLTKYFFYMVSAPWFEVWKFFDEMKWPKKTPKVSILIPAYNEEVGLLTTLQTILVSEYRNIEVIVINDGSTDNSNTMMRNFLGEMSLFDGIEVKYFYKVNGGKGKALNFGLERATGSIIMSIDADCVLTPKTVGNFVKRFNNPNVMAAVGNVSIGNTKKLLGMVQHLEFLFSFYFKKAESLFGIIYIIGGAAGAFRKEVFEKIGNYNPENITEDIELSVRIQAAGMKIVYASDAMVYTEGASSVKDLLKQRLRWKRGRFQTFFEHGRLFFSLRKKHNKLLTVIMLPLAYFGELQLFLEPLFLVFLYIYSYLTADFSSFISGIIVVSSMFFVQIAFDKTQKHKLLLMFLAPVGWLLFYVSTYVECSALIRSVWGSIRKQEVTWQKWEREGVGTVLPEVSLPTIPQPKLSA